MSARGLPLTSWPAPTQAAGRYFLEAALFVPAYLLLDWASYIEPLGSFNITPWNPGPALAIVWMIRSGLGRAPFVLLATFLADEIFRDLPGDYAITLVSALSLTGGYALMAAALRRLLPPERSLESVRVLTALMAVVAIGTALNGAAFLGVLGAAGLLSRDVLAEGWLRFWIGDVVGILVTAPLLLIAMDAGERRKLAELPKRAETYLQVTLLVATLWLILTAFADVPSHGFFLLFPPIIWIALRSGLAGALVAVSMVQLGVVVAFHQIGTLPIIELQALVATLSLTGLYLGAMVGERERAMVQLNQSLRLAAAGEMAGAITHEVSQPLTALANYSRSAKLRIQMTGQDPELAVLIDKIFQESLRSSQIVRRLREFFRAGSVRLEPLSSADLLRMIDRLGAEATRESGIAFQSIASASLPAVYVDRLQIELVLRNLISNAVESLQEYVSGRGRITVNVARERTGYVRVAVIDDGPGIPEGARDELFRPFTSGKPGGMGLGLSVSRAIAEAHGGSLDVVSASHGEFHLVLPPEPSHG